jgi:hypothetical protein
MSISNTRAEGIAEAGPSRRPLAASVPEYWAAAALYVALTLILTYPLSVSPHRNVIAHGPDDEEVLWILGWDIHAFTHHPLSIFDANIMYPERKTLAYAENLIGSALLAAPVMWLTGNLILAVNVAALLSCALCGLGAYVLGRRLGLSVPAAALCGVIFAFAPPRFMRTIQVHVGAVQWIPFALASLHKYFDEGRPFDVRLAVAFATLQALTSGHGAVFLGVAVAFLLASRVLLGEPLLLIRGIRDLGLPGLLLVVPAVLVFVQYRSVQQTLLGGSTLGNWRTAPESFLASPTPLHTLIRPFITNIDVNAAATAWLFPGYVPLALALVAIVWRRSTVAVDDQRGTSRTWVRTALVIEMAWLVSLAAAIAVSVLAPVRWRITDDVVFTARSAVRVWIVCSAILGIRCLLLPRVPFSLEERGRLIARWAAIRRRDPILPYGLIAAFCVWVSLAPPSPYWRLGLWRFIYTWPGLNFVRATSRFTVLGLLAVAVLAGIGFDRLVARRGARFTRMAGVTFGALLVLEFAMIPLGVTPFRIEFPGAERWLAGRPQPFVVAEVPITVSQTTYMLHSMAHWQKTIHGTARVIPIMDRMLYEALANFPDETSVQLLQQVGVTYVVVHTEYYPVAQRAELDERLRAFGLSLNLEYMDPGGRVYSLGGPQSAGRADAVAQSPANRMGPPVHASSVER